MSASGDLRDVLAEIERYSDAVPRTSASAELVGPFVLFVARAGTTSYARPRLGEAGPFGEDEIRSVRDRQRELGVRQQFEWAHETTPTLLAAAHHAGLHVHRQPLMVLRSHIHLDPPVGYRVRILTAEDRALPAALAAASVGFDHPGTARGPSGVSERDAIAREDPSGDRQRVIAHVRERIASGLTSVAVAEDESGPVASASHSPRGQISEIMGMATLPAARRQGIAAAVTSRLTQDARARGVKLCFLSAESADGARVYARAGFVTVATACVATPAAN